MRFVRTAESIFGLPVGFKRVEYIQSSGTQYIDTGYKPVPATTKFEFMFQPDNISGNSFLFGCRPDTSATSQYTCTTYFSTGSVRQDWAGFNTYFPTTNVNTKYLYTAYDNSISLNTDSVTGTITRSTTRLNFNFLLGTVNTNGTADDRRFIGKIYFSRLWDNGVLVRDFIPCIDPLGVACMYDLVGKKPYYNAGTGSFSVGRQVIPVEYLESTGTQYIDTGVGGDLNTELSCEAAIVQAGANSVTNIMGNNVTSSRAITINMSANITNPSVSRIRFGDTDTTTVAGAIDLNTFYKYTTNKDNLTVQDTGGTILNTYLFNATTAFTTDGNILIYKLGDTSTQYIGKIKVKGATIKNNGVLVRDFIPCKDENNVGYMFDRVSGTGYLNAGTGSFTYGDEVYTSKLRLIKDAKELPAGFKRVEYLQSDGSQYVDTGITINTATDEVNFTFQMISTTKYQWLMGEHDDGARFGVGVGDGTNLRNIAYGSTTYKVNDTEIYNSPHYFTANSGGVYLNGTIVHAFETFTSTSTVYLFKLNLSGASGAAGKIWRYTHKRNGVVVHDFVPCLDNNDVPCLYDLAQGKACYNQGTGDFTYGHIITPVEYLESDGTGAYIKSGITANFNSKAEVFFSCNEMVGSPAILGGRASASSAAFCIWGKSNAGYVCCNFSNTGVFNSSVTAEANTKYLAVLDNSGYTVNGDKTAITTTTTFTSPELYLFDANGANTSTTGTGNRKLVGKIYKAKIWDNGVLVRDYIPVRDENNVGYMFDKVSGVLYANAGTGAFTVGADLKQKIRFVQDVLPREYRPLKYLENTGTQWIDTGVRLSNTHSAELKLQTVGAWIEQSVFGARRGASDNNFTVQIANDTGATQFHSGNSVIVDFNNSNYLTYRVSKAYVDGKDYTCYISATKRSVDENIQTTTCPDVFTNQTNAYLFSISGAPYTQRMFTGKIYYCIIWDNGVPVRDFYPALRKSDNKPGMYDRITRQFFTNQGTGEFNYG